MTSTNTATATKAESTAIARKTTKPASKLDTLEKLLRRKSGASISEMTKATEWQQHSVRAALAGAMKKRGHMVTSEKIDGTRRYRIVGSVGE